VRDASETNEKLKCGQCGQRGKKKGARQKRGRGPDTCPKTAEGNKNTSSHGERQPSTLESESQLEATGTRGTRKMRMRARKITRGKKQRALKHDLDERI